MQAAAGARVTVLESNQRPVLRLRELPLRRLPRDFPHLLGRADQFSAVASALGAGAPVEVFGEPGVGKTALLRHVCYRVPGGAREGIVFAICRRQPVTDVLQFLVESCYESDIVFVPSAAELCEYLAERQVLVVLDDVELERSELEELTNAAPGCIFLLAAPARLLWGEGESIALPGLDYGAARELVEGELGRALTPSEVPAAEALCQAVEGNPLRVLQGAALMREGASSPASAFALDEAMAGSLSEEELKVVGPLAAVDGAALAAGSVAQLTGLPDAPDVLASLEGRGLVRSHSPRYSLAGPANAALLERVGSAGSPERLLTGLARQGAALQFPEDSAAVLTVLEHGERAGRWEEMLSLARVADPGVTSAGRMGAWGLIGGHALTAARKLGDRQSEGWALHQLGSRALVLGDRDTALTLLGRALELREALGDREEIEVTRHNLDQLGGGLPPPSRDPKPRGPRPPRLVLAVVAAAVAAATLAIFLLSSSGGSGEPTTTPTTATTRAATPDKRTTIPGRPGPRDPGRRPRPKRKPPGQVAAAVSPESLRFPYQRVGTESAAKSITVSNPGKAPVELGPISFGGPASGSFKVDYSECSGRLEGRGGCTITVVFVPKGRGDATASVDFSDVGNGKTKTVSLTGCGYRTGCDGGRDVGGGTSPSESGTGPTVPPKGETGPTVPPEGETDTIDPGA
ncbi:MAG: choice-of-anchor D domain-containing protein [Solirubrobacteraceae bacterium]